VISAMAFMVILSFVRHGVHMEFSSNGYTTTARRSGFIGLGGVGLFYTFHGSLHGNAARFLSFSIPHT
jgi:hypothetical protein